MVKFQSIINNHKAFEDGIEKILQYAQEVAENISLIRKIPQEEKYLILEALVLRVCAYWEKFLETEITLAVNLDATKIIKEMNLPRNTRLNLHLIRAILYSDIFRDFHEVDRAKSFFNKYIIDKYNPFTRITKKQKKDINFVYKLRNYLSHYSEFSKRILQQGYKDKYGLRRFIEPGQFLLSNNCKRFQELISSFKYASVNMKNIYK